MIRVFQLINEVMLKKFCSLRSLVSDYPKLHYQLIKFRKANLKFSCFHVSLRQFQLHCQLTKLNRLKE